MKMSTFYKIYKSTLVNLPVPSNLNLFWNFGSMLGMCLLTQIISGMLLTSLYMPSMKFSFSLVIFFMENIDQTWLLRFIHANGASLMFIAMYIHIGRGLFFNSFLKKETWMSGVTILLITMATAFMGYVLPMNQMSFWGASVITNLATEIPFLGKTLIKFIWGGASVEHPTMNRFFMFHFIMPFIILMFVIIHITLLHNKGSSNPLGLNPKFTKMKFSYLFSLSDLMSISIIFLFFFLLCLLKPLMLGDDENFTAANPAVTPKHIQPEWYFLFAYTILRSIPNKLGGVIALVMSVLILYSMPFTYLSKKKNNSFYPLNKLFYWLFIMNVVLLTWTGAQSIEYPYVTMGQIMTFMYFLYFIIMPMSMKMWDKLLL